MNMQQHRPAAPPGPSLVLATQALRQRDFAQAEAICRPMVQDLPDQPAGWHLLGSACAGQGRFPEAVAAYQRALRLRPGSADLHHALAGAWAAQGMRAEAETGYRQAIELHPDHGAALSCLGVLVGEQGRLEEAVGWLRRAVGCQPGSVKALVNLAVTLDRLGQSSEAEEQLRQAVQLQPDYADAHYNLGCLLVGRGQPADAIACFEQTLRFKPDHHPAYSNLGLALMKAGRLEEAVVIFAQAVRLRPQQVEGHNHRGQALADLGRLAEAEACFARALQIDPGHAQAHTNRGNVLKEQGRLEEALASYQVALWLAPESASAHWNRALAWLKAGDYERGWPECEWRWRRKNVIPRSFTQPRWDGNLFPGRTLLLYMEPGIGDMIQFVRFAALAKERGGTVWLECPSRLIPLFGTCSGIDRIVPAGVPLPAFDLQAPLMSLPGLLGTTLPTVPAVVPYLAADAERVRAWGKRLAARGGFRIGIARQGNPEHCWDRHRSLPLAAFAPLAALPGVRLIALQKGEGSAQLAELAGAFAVEELPGPWDPPEAAFADSAAVMQHLDLVIAVDSALAHLAGALGLPVWIALSALTDWRWLRDRSDSPWYPTARLFRQQRLGEWLPVMEAMARALVPQTRAARSVAVPIVVAPGELLDKLTILELKEERLRDPEPLVSVRAERALLRRAWEEHVASSPELECLAAALREVNGLLWQVEEDLRSCEARQEFGPRFVALARAVYGHNDRRTELKRQINRLLGAAFTEQKSYSPRS
jgi:tetratricopeptide (TPR) repeat protein